jgi:hypothetical protein
MSHHLDTPLAHEQGQLFIDDLYVFGAGHSTVLVMNTNSTITGPDVQHGFRPGARYEFKIHLDGGDTEGVTYRVSFGDADPSGRQPLELREVAGTDAHDDAAAGERILDGRTGDAAADGDMRIWAGRVADSFYIDLSLLSIVNAAVRDGAAPDLSAWHPENAKNSFADTTVESIVLEVSHEHPHLRTGADIGVWCRTMAPMSGGGWRQINRAGHPMMWPIFWPDDTDFSDPANTRHPSADFNAVGKYIGDQVAAVVSAAGTSGDPDGYGQVVARQLFPDVLPYIVGTPATFGLAGRNGRTLADNAPEVMLSLVLNAAVPSGLTPAVAGRLRADRFPYVVAA